MRRGLIVAALASTTRLAAADGAPPIVEERATYVYDAALAISSRMGPVPDEFVFWRLDGAIARTWWDRLHVGAHFGGGAGANSQRFYQATAELGVWLHPSSRLDLLLAYRLGRSWFAIDDLRVAAVAVELVIDLRFRIRDRVAVRFAPLVVSSYWSELWNVMLGPEVGAVVSF